MIVRVPYSVFSLPQLVTLADKLHQIVYEQHPEEALLSGVLRKLSADVKKARLAVGSSEIEAFTENVLRNDENRDDLYIGLTRHIEAGLRRHSMPAYQEACQRLMSIVDRNGRALYRYSYDKQTANLESFFDDLDNYPSRADLEVIHAFEWLNELKAANEAFKKAYAERGEQKVSKDTLTNEAALKLLKPSLDNLFTVIKACYINAQVEGIEKTIRLLNETIGRSLATARQGAG